MPTYEYICKNCGENFEVFQSFYDKPLKKHQACGGELKKVFHARGIVFKGSGFYATDAKGSSASAEGAGDKTESKPETKKKSDTKSDTKSKPEKKPAVATTD